MSVASGAKLVLWKELKYVPLLQNQEASVRALPARKRVYRSSRT